MSVDSPEPQQRTVAELLAENSGSQTGRRRRRRAAEDEGGPAVGGGPEFDGRSAPPPAPGRNGHGANGHGPIGYGPNGYAADRGAGGPPPSPPRGLAAAPPAPPARRPEPGPPPRAPRGEPMPPGGMGAAEPTGAFVARPPGRGVNGSAPAFGGPPPDTDGGPPTQLGAPPLDDVDDHEIDERAWTGEHADDPEPVIATAPRRATPAADGGPPTRAGYGPDESDDYDTGYDDRDHLDDEDHGERAAGVEDDPDEHRRGRRRGRRAAVDEVDELDGEDAPAAERDGKAAGTGQAWAMVIAQWIGGAIVGAAVWVGFRYLWTYFEIVALALSVVATVGLVLGVRAILRNDDLRTTMFAVLVGLLLTVSPALLVLLDR